MTPDGDRTSAALDRRHRWSRGRGAANCTSVRSLRGGTCRHRSPALPLKPGGAGPLVLRIPPPCAVPLRPILIDSANYFRCTRSLLIHYAHRFRSNGTGCDWLRPVPEFGIRLISVSRHYIASSAPCRSVWRDLNPGCVEIYCVRGGGVEHSDRKPKIMNGRPLLWDEGGDGPGFAGLRRSEKRLTRKPHSSRLWGRLNRGCLEVGQGAI